MKTTAEQNFRRDLNDTFHLLEMIKVELEVRQDLAEKEGIHWGHAGDAAHYKNAATRLLAALMLNGGMDSETEAHNMITAALADMNA
ncbi:MAG: hypothetical protein JXR97_02880 [Planctomycetes bacterium]|nr:hypothetical protein [Planctomycetota bacterium]